MRVKIPGSREPYEQYRTDRSFPFKSRSWFDAMKNGLLCGIILSGLYFASPAVSHADQPSSCLYSIFGFLVTGALACPDYGTPTVVSDAFPHASPTNGLLMYDEKLYFDDLNYPHGCPECYTMWSPASEKAKLCQYNKNGTFWYPLSDVQKRVILDLAKNYTFFVCPFTKNTADTASTMANDTTYQGTANVTKITKVTVLPPPDLKLKEWAGPNPTMTDAAFLQQMNLSGTHVPPWLKTIARWTLDGKIGESDFVNAMQYLAKSQVIG